MSIRVLHRAAAAFHRICSGDLSCFGGPAVTAAVAARLRVEQIGSILHYLPWMMLANAANALVLVAAFWMSPDRLWAAGWASAVVLYAVVFGLRSVWRRRTSLVRSVSERTVRRAVRNAFLLGCLWAVLPLWFFEGASSGQQLIITCLCAGMLGGGAFAFATLPVAAIAFASPLFIASAIAIARTGDQTYFLVAILLIVYSVIILRGVFTHALHGANRLARQIEAEEEARKDPLTNLGNRISFHENLMEAFTRLEGSGEPFALLFLDLNDFKSVNDRLGHAAGDTLLIQVADRLLAAKGETDSIARLGGDEFAVIATNIVRPEQAAAIAERIVKALDAPFFVDGHELSSAVSLGVAMAPANGSDLTSLLKNADIALYHAKRGAGSSIRIFEPSQDAKAQERRTLEHDLRAAIARDEFRLVFQPILNLASNRIVGCEALLRWEHPTRGILAPGQFIQTAEETGLIHAIGEWVLLEACRHAAGWPMDTKIAVNLSPIQLRRAEVLSVVVAALAKSELVPSRLEIEVTESSLIARNDVETLKTMRELGVTIALDDFGAGYSSLAHLRKLPLDRIKIDRSFIADLLTDRDCAAIVKYVVELVGDLGMSVTAEGVETNDQLAWLQAMGCAEAQGYLISTPKPAGEIAALFGNKGKRSPHAA
jgi:diguanylate cyclase (GGDEF)-like protein